MDQSDLLSKVTIIIPTYNEEEAIGKVIDELIEIGVSPQRIIVVDGHSSDRTVEIARSKGVIVVEQEGFGKSDAIKTGIRLVKTPYVLVMDGDYTYPAKHIVELARKALKEGYTEVIGVRTDGRKNIPLINRFGNWFLTKLFNLLFGTNLKDLLSGMYIVRTSVLRRQILETKGFSIESEIAAAVASSMGGRIGEVPIEYRKRLGRKKLKIAHGLRIFVDILKLAWKHNPVFFITFLGSLILVPGLILAVYSAINILLYNKPFYTAAVIGVFLIISGFQSLLIAVLALYLKRMEWRIHKSIYLTKEHIIEEIEGKSSGEEP